MQLEFWKIIKVKVENKRPLCIAYIVLFTFLALS